MDWIDLLADFDGMASKRIRTIVKITELSLC